MKPPSGSGAEKPVIIRDFPTCCHANNGSEPTRLPWGWVRRAMIRCELRFLGPTDSAPGVLAARLPNRCAGERARVAQMSSSGVSTPEQLIRRFLARLIPGRPVSAPRVYGPDAHRVRRSQISRGALDVTRKL